MNKAQRTVLRNQLTRLQLKYAREKDWAAVTLISGTIFILIEKGEI